MADAYIYRDTALAYAIYHEDSVIGLVILDECGKNHAYSFTDLFIADDFRHKGYGELAVRAIIDHYISKNAASVHMQVHKSNQTAIHVCEKRGFSILKASPWDDQFVIMRHMLKGSSASAAVHNEPQ